MVFCLPWCSNLLSNECDRRLLHIPCGAIPGGAITNPLKMAVGFKGAIAALENASWRPEAMEWVTTIPGAAHDGEQGRTSDSLFVFQLP
jgi:hypothetical protein